MSTTDWHVDDGVLDTYARRPRDLDAVQAASTEAHLLACERCRRALASTAPDGLLTASWASVADRIDAPHRSPVELGLTALGVSPTSARLASATPTLTVAWLLAVVAVTAMAVVLAGHRDTASVFVVVAPLLPVASVSVAFSASSDPAGEAGLATPLAGAGMLLRRAVAVVVASLVCVAVGAAALSAAGTTAIGWILPALGLTTGALALSMWRPVEQAAAVLASAWVVAVGVAAALAAPDGLDASPLLRAPGQLAALALALAGAAVVATRRDRLILLGAAP
ncbi:MAG: hypothetical protein MUF83_19720 [Acidimicrobiales bacterium]|jgi:hypothetical protein|nr:hypothetical protein [Acidimicrobiales bacterium]